MSDPLSLLGLAMRKGDTVFGVKQVIEHIQKTRRTIVFLAKDTGDNTAKKIRDKCNTYNITLYDTYTSDQLSDAIGKENVKVIALKDSSLLNAFK